MNFTEIYFKPFRGDPGGYTSYIWCDKSTLCFNILQSELKDRIIALLNGEENTPFKNVVSDNDYIIINGKPSLLVRGWGRLIGGGGLRLSTQTAKKIQNDFIQWTIKQLKKDE